MPLKIADANIKAAYHKLDKAKSNDVDDLLPLLAAVADKAGVTMTNGATMLKQAVNREQQIALVKEGLSKNEKKDLESILDNGTVKLSADSRKFVEQVFGRTPVNPTDGPVKIAELKKDGTKLSISGSGEKNATVEFINLSTIPTKRLHDDDVIVLGKTDAQGNFTGKLDARAGDWLRMRTRDANGKESDWVMVRADGVGTDNRGAEVKLERMELTALGGGKVSLVNNNNSRPISEPFAVLRYTNERTGTKTDIKLDDTGRFPADCKLPGKEGDTFTVAATDGVHDTALTEVIGKVRVADLGGSTGGNVVEDPLPHKDDRKTDGTARYELVHYTGPLFRDGAKFSDVVQGNIGDCFLPAAAAAIAHSKPGLFEQIIREPTAADRTKINKDRKARGEPELAANAKFYVVEFQQDRDGNMGKHLEAVDADFYARGTGGPVYGTSAGAQEPNKLELWWPLFEKAYAQLCGGIKDGYHSIGEGGSSADVFQAVLGRDWFEDGFTKSSMERGWRTINEKLKKNLPVAMGTYDDESNPGRFAGAGVFGDHTYTVLGTEEKQGVKYLKVRNPWGESEPFPGDGKDDGVFSIKLEDATKYFNTIWSVE
jgi:hypothetical protein